MVAAFLLLLLADHPRDPWVVRSVLDDRPRMVTLALRPGFCVAYDATTCGLYKAWRGEVVFQGAVYDTNHGPTPVSRGQALLTSRDAVAWSVTAGEKPVTATAQFNGYSFAGDVVTLSYTLHLADKRRITIRETPEAVDAGGATRGLRRRIEVGAIPEGMSVRVELGIGDARTLKVSHEGVGRLATPDDDPATFALVVDRPGRCVVTFESQN